MKLALNTRIGIIGAGPAGLSAAETLKNKGYTNVVLLEKLDKAGGKCCSMEYNGRWYELGAGILSENNTVVRGYAKKYGVKTELVDFSTPSLFLDAQTGLPLPDLSLSQKIQLLYQGLKYRTLIHRYHAVTLPGLSSVDPELCMPFNEWAEKHGLLLLAAEFAKYFTGFGYDFLEDVPAAYVLKYYSWETVKAFLQQKFYKLPGGIQNLWVAVAKHHDVRYNVTVTNIERSNNEVHVITDRETYTFDQLIVASPLDDALHVLDATQEEKNFFSQTRACDYRVYACVIDGFPKQTGYVPGNFVTARKGHPVFWYQRYADSNLYTFYVLAVATQTDQEIQGNIERLIRPLGGVIQRVETIVHWKYFPHVSSEQMRSGFFDRLEEQQGKKHTYYIGELLNFSTVEQSAWYAKTLVERFF